MDDGKTVPAKVVGTDQKTDLALAEDRRARQLSVCAIFARQAPRVGDWVIAVGNPFGLGGTVTAGIVSARGRDIGAGPYDDFLQIDAPVNRGNSGGPTFNDAGPGRRRQHRDLSRPPAAASASASPFRPIPSKTSSTTLKDKGTVARGWIGVQIQPVTQDIADSLGLKSTNGALVAEVQPNSPAGGRHQVRRRHHRRQWRSGRGPARTRPQDRSPRSRQEGRTQLLSTNGTEKTASVKLGTLPADEQAGECRRTAVARRR